MSFADIIRNIKSFLMDDQNTAGAPAPAPEGTAPVAGDQGAAPEVPAAEENHADTPEVEVEYRLSEEDGKHFYKRYENGGLVFTSEMFATREQAEAALEAAKSQGTAA